MTRGGRICLFRSFRSSRLAAAFASALDQDVEHDIGLVYGSPQPVFHPGNLENDLIQMPRIARARQPTADLIGECLTELHRPLPHRLTADVMPRAASISSTMRGLSGKPKYSQTA